MRASEAPPLRALIVAAAIVATLLGGGWWLWLDYHGRIEDIREHRDRLRLERLARARPGALRLVGVGSSLLQCAVMRSEALEEMASGEGLDLVYVRTIRPAGGIRDWRVVMDSILEAEPDVLLIEDFRAFYRLRVHSRLWARYLALWRKMLRRAVISPSRLELPKPPQEVAEWEERVDLVAVPRKVGEGELGLRRELWADDLIFGLRPGSREIFRRAAGRGCRVLVLEMPVHARARATEPPDHRRRIREELRQLEDEGLAEGLSCPLVFSEEDYLDLRHLGPTARERFSRWLLTELARSSHQLPTAGGDAPSPAVLSHLGVLDVLSSTPPRPSNRKPHWALHLTTLAAKPGEKNGLAAGKRAETSASEDGP